MTTHIDHAHIEREVAEYYRYATFSHKWEDNEPLFEKVIRIVVYDLDDSLTHDKLQMFCKIVRDSGFHWAWSDTCCINKADRILFKPGQSAIKARADTPVSSSISEMISGDSLWLGISRFRYGFQSSV